MHCTVSNTCAVVRNVREENFTKPAGRRNVQVLNVLVVKVAIYNLICAAEMPIYREGAVNCWCSNQKKLKCAVSFRKYDISGYCPPTTFLVQTGKGGINVYITCKPCL
jgi:hypothetical protein